jgi:hypothetical protein
MTAEGSRRPRVIHTVSKYLVVGVNPTPATKGGDTGVRIPTGGNAPVV